MPRPRTPTPVLAMRGAFEKHPDRKKARENEPVPKGALGDPPDGLNTLHVALWVEMRETGYWLTDADRHQVEVFVRAMVRFRDGDLKGGALAQSALAKLGFNPVDRSRINAGKPNDGNRDPAEAYFARKA